MQRPSCQFLSRSRLPLNEDTAFRVSYRLYHLEHLQHPGRLTDNVEGAVVRDAFPQETDLSLELPHLHCFCEILSEFLRVGRLNHIVEGSVFDRVHRRFHRSVCRKEDDRYVRMVLVNVFKQLTTILFRHLHISDNYVNVLITNYADRFVNAQGLMNIVAISRENGGEDFHGIRFIINDENVPASSHCPHHPT